MALKPIKSFHPMSLDLLGTILSSYSPTQRMIAGLNNVDTHAGYGIIDDNTRCLWTNDGHRVEIFLSEDGGFGASKSKEIDPLRPTAEKVQVKGQ